MAIVGGVQRAKNRGDKSCRQRSSQNTQVVAGLANCEETVLEGRSMTWYALYFGALAGCSVE